MNNPFIDHNKIRKNINRLRNEASKFTKEWNWATRNMAIARDLMNWLHALKLADIVASKCGNINHANTIRELFNAASHNDVAKTVILLGTLSIITKHSISENNICCVVSYSDSAIRGKAPEWLRLFKQSCLHHVDGFSIPIMDKARGLGLDLSNKWVAEVEDHDNIEFYLHSEYTNNAEHHHYNLSNKLRRYFILNGGNVILE